MAENLQKNSKKLVAGHIEEKKGYLYVVLNLVVNGKRKPKWIPTGLKAKGNKTRAKEEILPAVRREWTEKLYAEQEQRDKQEALERAAMSDDAGDMLFTDWLDVWLDFKHKCATGRTLTKKPIDIVTYAGYVQNVDNPIRPYFLAHPYKLKELTKEIIFAFYEAQLSKVKVATVKHYHAVIHGALNYAVDKNVIPSNPSDRMGLPQIEKFKGDYYSTAEVLQLFEAVQFEEISLPVMLAAYYGLRRSEVVGLKWNAFDFENDMFTIRHTVTQCTLDGQNLLVQKDKTKTTSSKRSLPLVPAVKERLLRVQQKQAEYRKLCGTSYCKDYLDYVCVDGLGELLKPNYITSAFSNSLKRHGLRKIRFHDLRHTCASLLLANEVPMEQVQAWLGHSEIGTTIDTYGHLEYATKVASANVIASRLQGAISA